MRILVTGGAGFLGSSLVESLVEQEHEVIVLDNCWRGSKEHLQLVDNRIVFIEQDACDAGSYRMIENPDSIDLVYHLAAINGTKWFHEEPRMVMDVNLNSTLRSLEFAEEYNCRYVFASSPEAFGESERMPLGNDALSLFPASHLHQRHAYGASKYLGELAVQHAVRQGLDARIVRPFNGYGPRLLGDEYGQVVSMMMESALLRNEIIVHGDGSQTRSFTWIDDVTDGFVKAGLLDSGIEGSNLSGHAFNIGSTEEISIANLAKTIIETSGKNDVEQQTVVGYYGDSNRRLPDIKNSKNLLGWLSKVSLQDGLNMMWKELINPNQP